MDTILIHFKLMPIFTLSLSKSFFLLCLEVCKVIIFHYISHTNFKTHTKKKTPSLCMKLFSSKDIIKSPLQ